MAQNVSQINKVSIRFFNRLSAACVGWYGAPIRTEIEAVATTIEACLKRR